MRTFNSNIKYPGIEILEADAPDFEIKWKSYEYISNVVCVMGICFDQRDGRIMTWDRAKGDWREMGEQLQFPFMGSQPNIYDPKIEAWLSERFKWAM